VPTRDLWGSWPAPRQQRPQGDDSFLNFVLQRHSPGRVLRRHRTMGGDSDDEAYEDDAFEAEDEARPTPAGSSSDSDDELPPARPWAPSASASSPVAAAGDGDRSGSGRGAGAANPQRVSAALTTTSSPPAKSPPPPPPKSPARATSAAAAAAGPSPPSFRANTVTTRASTSSAAGRAGAGAAGSRAGGRGRGGQPATASTSTSLLARRPGKSPLTGKERVQVSLDLNTDSSVRPKHINARHVIGCHFTQEKRVLHALDDVASNFCATILVGIRR